MSVMNRAAFQKDLEEGLNAHFGMERRELEREWSKIYTTTNTRKATEEDVLEVGFEAGQVKSEGGSVAYDAGGQGWSKQYVMKTISLAFAITEEAVEDNLYGPKTAKYAKALARAMHNTQEIYAAAVLNNAMSASHLGGDGVALLSDSHPLWGGGTFSNLVGTVDLSEAALEDAFIAIRKAVDDRSVPIALKPTDLIIPPDSIFVADRLRNSTQRVETANNDINAIRSSGMLTGETCVITRMSDTDQWLIKTDCPDGLKFFNRVSLQRKMEGEFSTGNLRSKVRQRYDFGYTDPRCLWGSMGG